MPAEKAYTLLSVDAAMTTSRNTAGVATTGACVNACHSSVPLAALSALMLPSPEPANTTPAANDGAPLTWFCVSYVHCSAPVAASRLRGRGVERDGGWLWSRRREMDKEQGHTDHHLAVTAVEMLLPPN